MAPAASPARDQTMEDILASIQRMISEGGDTASGDSAAPPVVLKRDDDASVTAPEISIRAVGGDAPVVSDAADSTAAAESAAGDFDFTAGLISELGLEGDGTAAGLSDEASIAATAEAIAAAVLDPAFAADLVSGPSGTDEIEVSGSPAGGIAAGEAATEPGTEALVAEALAGAGLLDDVTISSGDGEASVAAASDAIEAAAAASMSDLLAPLYDAVDQAAAEAALAASDPENEITLTEAPALSGAEAADDLEAALAAALAAETVIVATEADSAAEAGDDLAAALAAALEDADAAGEGEASNAEADLTAALIAAIEPEIAALADEGEALADAGEDIGGDDLAAALAAALEPEISGIAGAGDDAPEIAVVEATVAQAGDGHDAAGADEHGLGEALAAALADDGAVADVHGDDPALGAALAAAVEFGIAAGDEGGVAPAESLSADEVVADGHGDDPALTAALAAAVEFGIAAGDEPAVVEPSAGEAAAAEMPAADEPIGGGHDDDPALSAALAAAVEFEIAAEPVGAADAEVAPVEADAAVEALSADEDVAEAPGEDTSLGAALAAAVEFEIAAGDDAAGSGYADEADAGAVPEDGATDGDVAAQVQEAPPAADTAHVIGTLSDFAANLAGALAPAAAAAAVAELRALQDEHEAETDMTDKTKAAPETEKRILSEAADAAVGASFSILSRTVVAQNPHTVEDLVRDLLRPMLQGWLDQNLPRIVERQVREEIERVTRGS